MKLNLSVEKLFPFLRWSRLVNKETSKADLFAGLTGAAIVLPQGMAFASIAGMPPEYGLYTSIVPAIIAALFGSSWHLVSGPTTAASVVMLSSLSTMAVPGTPEYISLAITLAFMVGVIQLLMGFAKLGTLVNFISHSVVVGFTAGAALMIILKQFKVFLGLDIPHTKHVIESIEYIFTHSNALNWYTTVTGLTTFVSAMYIRKRWPKWPGMIIALLLGSLVALIFNLITGNQTNISMIGNLPRQLPPFSVPVASLDVIRDLAPVAFAMTLFALTEAVSIARSLAIKSGQTIQGNQEFIGQGLSNVLGSFFSAYVATGSFNRSGANYESGAKTPLASIIAGVALIPLILLVAPLTGYLPKAAVAGLLIMVAIRLIDAVEIRKIAKADKNELLILAVTFFSTMVLALEFAILLGVLFSLFIFLKNTSKPRLLPRVPDANSGVRKFSSAISREECPQLKILRLDESIYFGNVAHIGDLFRLYREKYPMQKHLFLLTKGVNQVDFAGAELLAKEARARRAMGGNFYMYRIKDSGIAVLKDGDYLNIIGEDNIFDSKDEAIRSIFNKMDRDICAYCDKRVFLECTLLPGPFTKTDNHELSITSAKKQQSQNVDFSV